MPLFQPRSQQRAYGEPDDWARCHVPPNLEVVAVGGLPEWSALSSPSDTSDMNSFRHPGGLIPANVVTSP